MYVKRQKSSLFRRLSSVSVRRDLMIIEPILRKEMSTLWDISLVDFVFH